MHDVMANQARFTIPSDGWYLAVCNVVWQSNAVGGRLISFRLNGTTIIREVSVNANSSSTTEMDLTALHYFTAGDYIEAMVKQTSGGALSVAQSQMSPFFCITGGSDVYLMGIEAVLCIFVGFAMVHLPLSRLL